MVHLYNPNNPTGSEIQASAIHRSFLAISTILMKLCRILDQPRTWPLNQGRKESHLLTNFFKIRTHTCGLDMATALMR